ncbi:MAG: beta family protein [Streptococcaceae bacterium]|jgi:hypothetical protein|nr:beta family protein [Streptococcaceae bacterium]MCH4176176.1 beta family protein [Streptococcaceae bacterium]
MTYYYPILKKGNSEIKALEELCKKMENPNEQLLPIIEAPQKSNFQNWEKDFRTFGKYLNRKIPNLNFAFQYSTAFSNIGGNPEESWASQNGLNIVEYIDERISEGCPNYIPCFNYDDPDWVLDSIILDSSRTIMVRIEPHKFENGIDNIIIPGTKSKFVEKFGGNQIIWLLDFYNHFSDLNRTSNLISLLDSTNTGKNVIFGATSCPEDASSINHSNFSIASVRSDINSFFALRDTFPGLSFADYTVRLKPVPSTEQRNQINMNNTYFKIFYTTDKNYMIAKSGLIKKQRKEPNHLTIQDICKIIVSSQYYSGSGYSWGDEQIEKCAKNIISIHDHQMPIQIGINHHLAATLNQL